MRIIIEFDTTTQPEVQVGSQTYKSLSSPQTSASSGQAIDAGPPKVGALQQGIQQNLSNNNFDEQLQDNSSAGAAPANIQ